MKKRIVNYLKKVLAPSNWENFGFKFIISAAGISLFSPMIFPTPGAMPLLVLLGLAFLLTLYIGQPMEKKNDSDKS